MAEGKIVSSPQILAGKPRIAGTRISVEFLLGLLSSGMDVTEILQEYPHLTREDIQVAVAYANRVIKNEQVLPLPAFEPSLSGRLVYA